MKMGPTRSQIYPGGSAVDIDVANPNEKLPRLLYAGDVPVQASHAGALLMFRLLQRYPAERLCIAHGSGVVDSTATSLPGVRHASLGIGASRLSRSRLVGAYRTWLNLTAGRRVRRVEGVVRDFRPEAVLTVIAGSSWLTADRIARRFGLPLHIIIHDEENPLPYASAERWTRQRFADCYRSAHSRLCISPFMEAAYRREFGVPGRILYPSHAADAPGFTAPPPKPSDPRTVVFAYAGSVYAPGLTDALRDLSVALDGIDARLEIYAGLTPDGVARLGLDRANIVVRPFLPSAHLIETLRREADVMFLPMSFASEDQANTRICFPTKFTDYTSTGLPLLVYGPPDCSAVRWTEERSGLAETVNRREGDCLRAAAVRLIVDADHRAQLGTAALSVGARYFSHAAVTGVFYRSLTGKAEPT